MRIPYLSPSCRHPALLNGKMNGAWRAWPADEVRDQVGRMARGLRALGLQPGDRAGILADPSPQWVMMDLAIQAAGGVSVPLFTNISPENLEHEIRDCGMSFLFAATEKDLERAAVHASGLRRLITLAAHAANGRVLAWSEVLGAGDAFAGEPSVREPSEDAEDPDALATIVYTSGSTGFPKGVMLTRANFEAQVRGTAARFPLSPETDVVVSVLPLAHVFERMAMYYFLSVGCPVHFADDAKRLGEVLREVRPTVLTAVPRLLERVQAKMLASAEARGGPGGALARRALRAAAVRDPEAPHGLEPMHRLAHALFDALVYARLRKALGGRLRFLISGGSALPVPVARFFRNLGLPLFEGYGMTECSPVITANYPGNARLGTVGKPYPGVEVAVDGEGEILVRGANVMKGYLGREAETREVLGADGWLRTGDLGAIDADGFLRILGRKKELFKTSTGEYVSPVPLEAALTAHPLIDAAVVIAEGRKFASCLIAPDFERLDAFRAAHGLGELALRELLRHPRFLGEMESAVEDAGKGLNPWERLRRFRILEEPFSTERGEMTPTLKVRRHAVEARYAGLIAEMYEE
jgi:long-chain acyl-CoA synthetase